jgi:hypothetical protein
MAGRPMRLFLSYAHEDATLRERLEAHMAGLRRAGVVEPWSDRGISPGSDWGHDIDQRLQEADIVLLLVSADFMNSAYAFDIEVQRAMRRHEAGEAVVIPVVLKPVDWQDAPFAALQALPTGARAVTSWPDPEEGFLDIVRGLRTAIAKRAEAIAQAEAQAAAPPDPPAASVMRPQSSAYGELSVSITTDEVAFTVDGTDYRGRPDFSDATLARLEQLRGAAGPDEYGAVLFDAVFAADPALAGGYDAARARIRNRMPHRLRLDIDADAEPLQSLWWEALHDHKPPPRRLATQHVTPLSRFTRGSDVGPLTADRLRLLVVVASPRDLGGNGFGDLSPIDRDAELATIEQALRGVGDRVEWATLEPPASPFRIRQRLLDEGIHVLHLVCHGVAGQPGQVLLERSPDGGAERVDLATLGDIVRDLDQLRLVLLDTGHTPQRSHAEPFPALGSQLVRLYEVPALVAMHNQVCHESSEAFTRAFYETLLRSPQADGLVDVAANRAREAVRFQRGASWEWAAPVVFIRGGGRLYAAAGSAATRDVRLEPARTSSSAPPPARAAGPPPPPPEISLTPSERLNGLNLITSKHDLTAAEIDDIAWALGIRLSDASRDAKARELIEQCRRADQLQLLMQQIPVILGRREKAERDPVLRALQSLPAAS